jgi:hypothetical protein
MKYICQYCGKEFNHHFSLVKHMNRCEKNNLITNESKCHQNFISDLKNKFPELLNHIEIIGIFYNKRQSSIKVKCKHCEETYEESINNIIRYGTWKCSNHCSQKIRRQNELNKRKENLINIIKEKNSEFLNKYDIISDWDGQIRSKIKVKCKRCGIIKNVSYGWIINTDNICKGCTVLNNFGFNKLILQRDEIINWCKQYKLKLLERLKILSDSINLLEDKKIKCKCLKCNSIIEISIGGFFRKDTKNILCPICQKRHNETEDYLISLIKSHKVNNEKYVCEHCGREFKSLNGFNQHKNWHIKNGKV